MSANSAGSSGSSYKWPSHVASKMADFIHEEVKEMLTCSRLVRKADGVSLVHRKDLTISRVLGKGAFSEVHEVVYEGDRFAMKHLKLRLMSQPDNFRLAASELAVEAHMLASFDHPNILKIRGWAYNGIASFADGRHDSFFLLLDRLDETLDQRIIYWQKQRGDDNDERPSRGGQFGSKQHGRKGSPAGSGYTSGGGLITGLWNRLTVSSNSGYGGSSSHSNSQPTEQERINEQKRQNLYLEKLGIVTDIASALSYLHNKGVIFRDLKPNNIGFLHGRVQLFDFGLSRELPALDLKKSFEMSGKVGTLRYMAVEVACHKPYNVSADVYSWAMVCYEMITLQKPFAGWTRDMHANLVCGRGVRPEIPRNSTSTSPFETPVPNDLRILLEQGWSHRCQDRPSMSRVLDRCRIMEQNQLLVCHSPLNNISTSSSNNNTAYTAATAASSLASSSTALPAIAEPQQKEHQSHSHPSKQGSGFFANRFNSYGNRYNTNSASSATMIGAGR